jgi:hypothetical protein
MGVFGVQPRWVAPRDYCCEVSIDAMSESTKISHREALSSEVIPFFR